MNDAAIKVLLVEDNPGDARLIQEMLREAGGERFEVRVAERLATALEDLAARPSDVVLLDLGLPDSQGFDTFARIHTRVPGVPIVVLTGLHDEALATQAVREGAQDYLVKGQTDGRLLVRAIRYAIERSRVHEVGRFFALSRDMLCIAGFDGYFKRLNPAWEQTLGFTNDELLARPYLEFVHPDDRPATLAEAQKLTTGALTIWFENRYRCQDGSYKWILWSAAPLPEEQLIYAVARDITERKQAEEETRKLNRELERRTVELETLNRELEAFTYSVSHDLRAPLRHVAGFSRILMEELGPRLDASARHYLQRVQQGTHQMGLLVDDLLNLAHVARQGLRQQVTGLNSLVEEALADLKPEMEGRAIEWRIGQLPFVDCDAALMKQVFANLLSNAVKFSRPRPRALIQVDQLTRNGERVVFVRDNGVGFSMKYASKLFGVFQRLHRQEDFEGTGVGLATVQRIIHKHGGRVWAEGELDQGATFYFTLGMQENTAAENPTGLGSAA